MRVLEGKAPFAGAAEEAALLWQFEPATRAGAPVAVRVRFEAVFTESADESETSGAVEEGDTPSREPTASSAATAEPRRAEPELEVLVGGERRESAHRMTRAEVRQLPGAFGDPFRAIEALPGVTPIVSGLPYFYVRGSPPGNVGFFLDDVRLPVLFHIGAGPAVLHPAFIETVELYPGPYPARYGRFIGGVVAGQTAEPRYETRGEASIRLVDAGAMVETHALDKRLSVMLGGRYSYTAAVISLIAPELDVSYWDYQARVQYRPSPTETVTVFGMGSLDNATETRASGQKVTLFDLVFHRLSARYRRELADGGFWELRTLAGWDITGGDGGRVDNRMGGVGARFERPLTPRAKLRGGVDVQMDRYGWPAVEDVDVFLGSTGTWRTDLVTGAQLDVPWEVQRGLRVTPGARFDVYFSGSSGAMPGFAPAVLAELDLSERVTLLQGFGVAQQLPSFVIPLPGVQPRAVRGLQQALQHSAGVRTDVGGSVTATATVFQNVHLNLSDALGTVNTGVDIDLNQDPRGLGGTRGLELLLQRSLSSDFGGYLSYTLSATRRSYGRFSGYSAFDRRHVLGGALGYQLSRGWIAGARGTFYTGIPGRGTMVETPSFEGGEVMAPPRIAAPRTRPFWRLDWRLEKRWMIGTQGGFWALVAEVLNTTLNKEMVERTCDPSGCRSEVIGPVTIPSLGVEASL